MVTIRPAGERGHEQRDWLDSYHTFSFAGYHDPAHMGFRKLRVINEDFVKPGGGFGMHEHANMEIFSYVISGALEHRDSLGNGAVIRPGDVYHMTAGTGIRHSEFNPSDSEVVHFLQIWVLTGQEGLPPHYEQRHFPAEERRGRLRVVAAGDGREGALAVPQDMDLYAALLDAGQQVAHPLREGRHAWVQVVRGALRLNGHALAAGDGAAVSDERSLELVADQDAEFLVFDLA